MKKLLATIALSNVLGGCAGDTVHNHYETHEWTTESGAHGGAGGAHSEPLPAIGHGGALAHDASELAVVSLLSIDAEDVADGDEIPTSLISSYPSGEWHQREHRVIVPEPGLYELELHARFLSEAAVSFMVGESEIGTLDGDGDVRGLWVVPITDPPKHALWLRNDSGVSISSDGSSQFKIQKIGDL